MQKWRQEGEFFCKMADQGKCLDAYAPTARQDGGKVQVWSCEGGLMQLWIPSPVGSETMTGRCSGDVFFRHVTMIRPSSGTLARYIYTAVLAGGRIGQPFFPKIGRVIITSDGGAIRLPATGWTQERGDSETFL